jgi:hypothetical protein
MQPDNIRLATRIPNFAFSDVICALPIEELASHAKILRRKRHDSINPIIGKNRRFFQCLDACSALREAGCGFWAASFAICD